MTKRLGRKQSGIMVLLLSLMVVTGVAGPASAASFTSDDNGAWTALDTWGEPPYPGTPGSGDTANAKHAITFGTQSVGTLNLMGGILSGNTLTIELGGTWSNGIFGTGTYDSLGIYNIVIGADRMSSGSVFNNAPAGTINQSAAYQMINDGTALNNSGTYNIKGNYGISNGVSGTPVITNTGTFAKTEGTGTSTISGITFHNDGGTVAAQTGILSITSMTGTGGTLNASAGATLYLGADNLTGLYTGSGEGKVQLNGFKGNATFNMPGNLLEWRESTIEGTLTNVGTLGIVLGADRISGGTLNNTASGTINQSAAYQMINDGTALNNSGTYNIKGNYGISNGVSGTPVITNTGTFAKTEGTGTSTVSNILFKNSGVVEVRTGTLSLAKVEQLSGTSTTLTGGTWNVVGDSTLVISSGSASGIKTNQGSVTLSGANSTFAKINALETITNEGSFTIKNGRNFTTAGNLTNAGALTVGAGSTLWIDEGGTGTFTNTGTVSGSGSIIGSFVNNGGTISPGSSPGSLTIDGNYTQTGGALDFEIQNTNPGFFDQLFITGNATITDSTFNISLWPGYDIKNNDTFTLIDANGTLTITNPTFSGLDPAGPLSFTWFLDTANNDLLLTAHVTASVPEPASLLLLLGGLLPLGIAGRRKEGR